MSLIRLLMKYLQKRLHVLDLSKLNHLLDVDGFEYFNYVPFKLAQ